jgi:hypothetical protein
MTRLNTTIIFSALALLSSAASAQTLYNGALGTTPGAQGWTAVTSGSVESFSSGATTFDSSSANGLQGGYSTFAPLNRTTGFTLSFGLQVLSETHVSNDRAGLSIIAITSDLQGIELGFWGDRIWAQSGPAFTRAEEGLFNTTLALTGYDLRIFGTNYALFNGATQIVSGPLRNYSSFGLPYNLTNFIFIGDDTTSARGAFRVSSVQLASAPEPGVLGLLLLGGLPILARMRRR